MADLHCKSENHTRMYGTITRIMAKRAVGDRAANGWVAGGHHETGIGPLAKTV